MFHTPPMEQRKPPITLETHAPDSARLLNNENPSEGILDRSWRMKQFACHKLVIDFFLLCLLGVGIVVFKFVLKEAYQRGFYCDDETIRYPLKPSTVSTGLLMGVSIPIPILTILFFESLRLFRESRADPYLTIPGTFAIGNRTVHRYLVRIYIFIGYFLAGACMSQMMTDIAKYSIGRLRPHFIAVCNPDFSKLNCTNGPGHMLAAERYIVDVECRGMKEYADDPEEMAHLLRESRVSFPSGHASFSFYCAIYTVLYLESRVVWPLYRPLLRPILAFVYVALAFACSLSRISNYRHHWSDVLAGAILGTSIALITGFQVAQLFARRETTYEIKGSDNLVLLREVIARAQDDENGARDERRPHALQPVGTAPRADKTHL